MHRTKVVLTTMLYLASTRYDDFKRVRPLQLQVRVGFLTAYEIFHKYEVVLVDGRTGTRSNYEPMSNPSATL